MIQILATPYEGTKHFSDDSLSSSSEKEVQLKAHLDNLQDEYTTTKVPKWHPLADPNRQFDEDLKAQLEQSFLKKAQDIEKDLLRSNIDDEIQYKIIGQIYNDP